MIHVVVTMYIEERNYQKFIDLCRWISPLVIEEQGCRGYDFTSRISEQSAEDTVDGMREIILIEQWETAEDLAAHGKTPHMQAFRRRSEGLRKNISFFSTRSVEL